MTAPLYQVQISIDDEPAADRYDAEMALQALGVEYDAVLTEDEEAGIYLVGLLGRHADTVARGDYLALGENGIVVEVPQP